MPETMYERRMAGLEPAFEVQLSEVVALAVYWTLAMGDGVADWGVMAERIGWLAKAAEGAGDAWLVFGFSHWQAWAEAASRGEEYELPEWPGELLVLP